LVAVLCLIILACPFFDTSCLLILCVFLFLCSGCSLGILSLLYILIFCLHFAVLLLSYLYPVFYSLLVFFPFNNFMFFFILLLLKLLLHISSFFLCFNCIIF
jgi:hypothetical protein